MYGSIFGFEHALDGFYRMLGFAEKPMDVLEPNSIIVLLVSSVIAGIFLIAAAMITGILSCIRRGLWPEAIFSVNGAAGLVFYFSLLATLVELALGYDIPFVCTPASVSYTHLFRLDGSLENNSFISAWGETSSGISGRSFSAS